MRTVFESALLLLFLWGAGCAWVPQKVTIAPHPSIASSAAGNGVSIAVDVRDARPSSRIGSRGIDAKGAEITSDQDLAQILREQIVQGLNGKGFKAGAAIENPAHVLKVELQALDYTTEMNYWQGTIRTKAVLRASSRSGNAFFEKPYVVEREQTVVEAPRARTNEQLINQVLSDILERLLGDTKLIQFLAS